MFGAGGNKPEAEARTLATERYNGFEVQAAPVKESGGWRVSGLIRKEIDGEIKQHHLVRADTCADAESATALTLTKAHRLIDEQGERLFD